MVCVTTHRQPAPILGTQQVQLERLCRSYEESQRLMLAPIPRGKYTQMRRSFCRVRGMLTLTTPPIARLFIRGDSAIAVNNPRVLQAVALARQLNSTDPTGGVAPDDVLNGGTLSTVLVFAYHVANATISRG